MNAAIASLDVQKLVLESAEAERIERELNNQAVEALKNGDAITALRLRGKMAEGDVNYNPHHSVDDFAVRVGEGDGAMYASNVID
jgi:hypothetical protein